MTPNFRGPICQKRECESQEISKDNTVYSDEEQSLVSEELAKKNGLLHEPENGQKDLNISMKDLYYPVKQHQILDSVPTQQVYKIGMIWLAGYLGGPLAAGYIIAANFKAFGQIERAKKTWIYTIVATIVLLTGNFFIPAEAMDRIPNFLIPLIYTGIAALLMNKYQGDNIGIHFVSGGHAFSWGRVIVVGLIGLVITFGVILCVIMLLD